MAAKQKWQMKSSELEALAADGDIESVYLMAVRYERGREDTGEKDEAKALELYHKAAEQGFSSAQMAMGTAHFEGGLGVAQDYTETVAWWLKAAEQGNYIAQHNMGIMYEEGKGVEQDDAKAVEWYSKAVKQGDWSAKCRIDNIKYR